MKIIAICFNVLLFLFYGYILIDEGFPEGVAILFLLFVLAVPIINIVALLLSKSDSWLSCYFKRKTLEEKKKIATLEKEAQQQENNQ